MKKISILNIIYTVFMEKNKKILKFYNKNGFYIFKNFYNKSLVEKIKKEIFYISSKLYKEKTNQKIIKYNSKKFDYYVLKSKKERLNDVNSAIYNTCKKLPSFFKIISHNQTYNICKFLMGSKNIGILNHGFGIRIDFPRDNFWKARLHQDYTSQLGSPNGIVIYSAFDSVSKKQGPVILYKGSHNPGIFKTLTNYKKVKQKKTYDPYYIDIKKYELKRFKKFHLVLRERDMALFDFRMLHESGNNFSNKIRWSAIHRIFDLSHKDAIKNFFKGGMKESVLFKK